MPLLSLGGMRFQQSWSELTADQLTVESQANLEATLAAAVAAGMHHVETARHYGSSELQLGKALRRFADPKRILQTKLPPQEDSALFEAQLERSFEALGVQRVDLLAVHGLNLPEHLEQTLRPGGCIEVLQRWRADGCIGHLGFSTHAPTDLIVAAVESDAFDFLNLHWYFIRQENQAALEAARRRDMGVFLISPTDKGGHLHSPSKRLETLCSSLHPIVFNDLFCLSSPLVHTISVGAARPGDLDLHLQAVGMLDQAEQLLPAVIERLDRGLEERLGRPWLDSWQQGLPPWQETPGQINLPLLLWLYNLLQGWELESYCRARYGLLGNGGHWFPGRNANGFGADPTTEGAVTEEQLLAVLDQSPWRQRIPGILRELRQQFSGEELQRLSN
jgi:predicted aldo/keto reductase-like oxidoreductase